MLDLVVDAVRRMRAAGTDLADIEAKRATGGFPSSAIETVCAFHNTSGGLLLLGIDEEAGFAAVDVDAAALADELADKCSQLIEPPVRPEIDVLVFEGRPVVAARVEEAPATTKPAYVRARGMINGSFVRTHDGDRRMTPYEVQVLLAGRGQPVEDEQVIAAAAREDLDADLVAALVDRLRSTRGPAFTDRSDDEILHMVGVVAREPGAVDLRPTLTGLLALGRYPQQFFPQLDITFVAFPTVTGEPAADGTRFLDNATIDGSIPQMLTAAANAIQRNMSRRSVVTGLFREDHWEYPSEAVREVIANALMHRDLAPTARGAQIRIELYPDRLEVVSPGGLHGPVDPEALLNEPVSSSRNARLAKLLEDVTVPGTQRTVVENRGSGLLALARALRQVGMQPPELNDSIREFKVRLRNTTLLDDEALRWLAEVDTGRLTDQQRLGAAYAHRHGRVSNAQYRVLTGLDAARATRDLAALASMGLLTRTGDGRGSIWEPVDDGSTQPVVIPLLTSDADDATAASPAQAEPWQREAIRRALRAGPMSTAAIATEIGVGTKRTALNWLRRMEADGAVEPTTARRRSPTMKWRLSDGR
jgi:ATP-dependent DNA helicase RecG